MNAVHTVSGAAFAGLAAGEGGAQAVGELCAAQASKHRLLVRLLVAEAHRTGHPHTALVSRAYSVLSELETAFPAEVDRCLRHPAVGAWALHTCRTLPAGGGDPGRLSAVALAAAIRTRSACRLEVPVPGGELMLPSLGLLTLPGDLPEVVQATVEPAEDGAELHVGGRAHRVSLSGDEPGWQALHHIPVSPDVRMTIDDLDPYRWPGDDVGERLTGERRQRWAACLREAWQVLLTRHPTVAGELAAAVSVLTPVVTTSLEQHSASARDTFGTIALSDPIDGIGMALTLTHELQHTKLNALSEVVELVAPDDGRRFYAPWRPDPRPVFGLLHGAYAHAGVARFWRRHTDDPEHAQRAQVEFARWREAAYQVTGTLLGSGALTEAGTHLVTTLRGTLARWLAEPVTPAAAVQARLRSENHKATWAGTRT
ncbi:HEXXH motif domain-containing protein [Nonomuraea diastatica]|uniref:HEXXH motif domain-containing protein n=1 Tax=Nonomuraea diastatica TaxID=1848329 RepID=A0A4R4WYK2_9ACTN|nr:HEXXH motif domain-containing protein [Nonomuraea diastatica]TDD22845.1 HEXXH motif domain-containing protein [Nonomuraea diastatica]